MIKLSPFSPKKIPGLILWLDASQGVTLVDDHVSAWADQSGNLRHATQEIDDSRPHLVASALNGKPVLRFDGMNDFLNFTGPNLSDFTVFFVCNRSGDLAFKSYLIDDASVHMIIQIRSGYGAPLIYFHPLICATYADDTNISSYNVYGALRASGVCNVYNNGRIGTSSGNVTTTWSPPLIGYHTSSTFYFCGDIAEIIIYPSALTTAQINQVNLYLSHKWNITVDLA